jgi:ribosome recycling factor
MKKVLLSAALLLALGATVASAQGTVTMPPLTPEQTKVLTDELTRFGKELALSDTQKEALRPVLGEQMNKIKQLNSLTDLTSADKLAKYKDIRSAGYERIKGILSPEQLTKWDAEMVKAKDFLGAKVLR